MQTEINFDLARIEFDGDPMLVVYGELDVSTSPRLHEALNQIIAEHPKVVLVDLANVTFLDSSGLGALVVADRHLREAQGVLDLVAVPERIMKVFEITGLSDRFNMHEKV